MGRVPYIGFMKHIIAAIFFAATAALPVSAQENDTPQAEGFNLIEQGAKLLLRGLMDEIEPAMDEMGAAITLLGKDMGPVVAQLLGQIDDLRNYRAPEVLPNGDIILRRIPDAPDYDPDPDTGAVDL